MNPGNGDFAVLNRLSKDFHRPLENSGSSSRNKSGRGGLGKFPQALECSHRQLSQLVIRYHDGAPESAAGSQLRVTFQSAGKADEALGCLNGFF